MSSDIQVDSEVLRSSASQAKAAANQVSQARKAGASALPANAFGIMCSPLFLPMYGVVETAADALIDSMSQSIERAASNLVKVAESFDEKDETDRSQIFGSW
jgi:hypothetical protein